MRADWKVKKVMDSCRHWIESGTAEKVLARARPDLDEDFKSRDISKLQLLAIDLQSVAHYYGTIGIVQALDGDRESLRTLGRSVLYYLWIIKTHSEAFIRWKSGIDSVERDRLTRQSPRAAACCCMSILANNADWFQYTVKIMCLSLVEEDYVHEDYANDAVVEPFVLSLVAGAGLDSSVPKTVLNRDCGAYEPLKQYVLRGKGDVESAVRKSCDYHCVNMLENQRGFEEFADAPFDLLPAEFLLIGQLYPERWKAIRRVKHPLLETGIVDIVHEGDFLLVPDDNTRATEEFYESVVSSSGA